MKTSLLLGLGRVNLNCDDIEIENFSNKSMSLKYKDKLILLTMSDKLQLRIESDKINIRDVKDVVLFNLHITNVNGNVTITQANKEKNFIAKDIIIGESIKIGKLHCNSKEALEFLGLK